MKGSEDKVTRTFRYKCWWNSLICEKLMWEYLHTSFHLLIHLWVKKSTTTKKCVIKYRTEAGQATFSMNVVTKCMEYHFVELGYELCILSLETKWTHHLGVALVCIVEVISFISISMGRKAFAQIKLWHMQGLSTSVNYPSQILIFLYHPQKQSWVTKLYGYSSGKSYLEEFEWPKLLLSFFHRIHSALQYLVNGQ